MNAEHRHQLEQNELAASVQTLWEKAKAGKLISHRAGRLMPYLVQFVFLLILATMVGCILV